MTLIVFGHADNAFAQLRAVRSQAPALPPPTMIPTEGARQSATPYNPPPISLILARPRYNLGGYIGGYFPYYTPNYGDFGGNGYNTINYNTFNINVPETYSPPRNFAPPADIANDYPSIARLMLQVPANAVVTVNDKNIDVGGSRTIESPELKANENFTFDVKVTWTENGKPVEEKRSLTVKAGEIQSLQYLALPTSAARLSR